MPILFSHGEGHAAASANGEANADTTESKTLCMRRSSKRENRETLWAPAEQAWHVTRAAGRLENVTDGTAGMNADRESDGSVVPAKPANKGGAEPPAESAEERGPAKKNAKQEASHRTPGRTKRGSHGLPGVSEAARKDSTLVFTALLHHVNEAALHDAFFSPKKRVATGVDGVSWHDYEQDVEANPAAARRTYTIVSTGEPTGPSPRGEAGYPKPTAGNGRWGLRRWRTRSSSEP